MTKTYTIPITCRELRYIIYFAFPAMLVWGMFTANWHDGNAVPALNFGAVILGGVGTIMITILKLVDMEDKGEFPSFRCKCDNG